jgi:hypothetical protein
MAQPRGYGSLQAPVLREEPKDLTKQIADDIRALKTKAVPPPVWQKVPLSITSGAFAFQNFNRTRFSILTVTVTAGTLWVYFGSTNNASQTPDLVFSAGDTRQIAISDQEWDQWSFYASGANTTATLYVGQV